MVGETGSVTGPVVVYMVEATAVETLLYVSLGGVRVVPSHLQQLFLLILVDGQTGAGDRELDDEHHEEDDHIEEE